MLASKLKYTLEPGDYCGTIHNLIYILIGVDNKKIGENEVRPELFFELDKRRLNFDLIIVDEASMISEQIYDDLAQHGIPIVAVGDHGQLPPIAGNFNLMEDPDIKLEKIMRQAEDDPIIQVSIMARLEGHIPFGNFGDKVKKTGDIKAINEHHFDDLDSIILCATNSTRKALHRKARETLGIVGDVQKGEPVICLQNNSKAKIFNGNIGVVEHIEFGNDDAYEVRIGMGDFDFQGYMLREQFNRLYTGERVPGIDLFDWAYAITVHKSQGSEWNHVTLYEDRMRSQDDDNWRRWLYTAVTRAKESLLIIG